jgi:hypothetical protein
MVQPVSILTLISARTVATLTATISLYDVHLEADDPTPDELVSNNQSENWYEPRTMEYNTQYYWQIAAWDNYGKY